MAEENAENHDEMPDEAAAEEKDRAAEAEQAARIREALEVEPDKDAAPLRFQQIMGQSAIGDKNVDRFSDVPLRVAIELGRVNVTIREILELKEGSIVETKKLSGQPMEIMVNDRLFGHGEVVVVGDNLAIRITELEKPDLT